MKEDCSVMISKIRVWKFWKWSKPKSILNEDREIENQSERVKRVTCFQTFGAMDKVKKKSAYQLTKDQKFRSVIIV